MVGESEFIEQSTTQPIVEEIEPTETTELDLLVETTETTETTTETVVESATIALEEKEQVQVRFYLSDDERIVVENIVMGEAGAESYEGQVLVAQCILNACIKEGLQPSEVRKSYQYAGWNTNPTKSVKKAVRSVFDNGFELTNEPILYFYNPNICKSDWHETQRLVVIEGSHKFFAEV